MKTLFLRCICTVSCLVGACSAQAAVQLFACEPEWAALAREIAGDLIEVTTATSAMQDPHYVQARPGLIARVRRADLLICSGSGLEAGWLPLLLRKGNNPKIQPGQPGFLMASQWVERLDIPASLDRSLGDLHAEGNPHIHLDPRNLAPVARVIAQRLAQIDPANAGQYQQGLVAFERNWKQAISRWEQRAAPLRGTRTVVHHKSWAYLDNWLGLEAVASLERKPGVPPSAAQLSQLLKQLQLTSAAVIIRTPYQDARPSQWLSKRTGIPEVALPFTVGGDPAAVDLYSLFDVTIALLLEKTGAPDE